MVSDHYETLEINRNATDADIKKAFRRLALKFHPSRNKQTGSAEKFSQVGEAYDVLSDLRKKATYDKFGEDGLKGGIPPEFGCSGAWSSKYVYHGNPEKTFREFFGGDNPFADFFTNDAPLHFGGLQPGVVKTQDPHMERDLHLTLDDLFNGCTKKVKISRRVINEDGCTSSIRDKILTIAVKPGWKEGARIIFPKEGDQNFLHENGSLPDVKLVALSPVLIYQLLCWILLDLMQCHQEGPNSIPADIVFIVRQESHPLFVRQGSDLIYKVQITLKMALTGFSMDVQTLDGRLITIPINDIVHPSYNKVVTGVGMPLSQDLSQRGNLIVTFDIQFPKKLSAESRDLIKQALASKY